MRRMDFEERRRLRGQSDPFDQMTGNAGNPSLVLVICASAINRIVIARIVEQAGLKAVCEAHAEAVETFAACQPGLVIIDRGPDDEERHPIISAIVDRRRATNTPLPKLIVLSTKGAQMESAFANVADAVVAKPFTPEALQPKIEQLIESAGR